MTEVHTVTVEGFIVTGMVTFEKQDDSFDHEFGTERKVYLVGTGVELETAINPEGEDIEVGDLSPEIALKAVEQLQEVESCGECPDDDEPDYEPDDRDE